MRVRVIVLASLPPIVVPNARLINPEFESNEFTE
jgi:hypothetical protein